MKPSLDAEYLKVKDAAAYCGYNRKHFSRIARKHQIPRHGPKLNRFKRSDLDVWMRSPTHFIGCAPAEAPRDGFHKVSI